MVDRVHSGLTASIPGGDAATVQPHRVQLRRTKGWRMQENTVKVDRSTRWGNPERADVIGATLAVEMFRRRFGPEGTGTGPIHAIVTAEVIRRELAGKNLACWCRLDQPCHADVLLEIANQSPFHRRDGGAASVGVDTNSLAATQQGGEG